MKILVAQKSYLAKIETYIRFFFMRYLIVSFFCYVIRALFCVRYKIKVVGEKGLNRKKFHNKAGILFLPNHPALVDPIFLFIILWPKFQMRPLVIEYIYRQKFIGFFMKVTRSLSVPDLDTSLNELKIMKTEKVLDEIVHDLKNGENYLLYPAGKLKGSGREIIGGSSATHTILQKVSNVNVMLIRVSGLWGSSFSKAYTQKSPDFNTVFLRNLKNLLKGLIFFLPKRRVLIELELAGKDFPRKGTRLEVNRYLESWYNQYPEDINVKNSKRVESEPLQKVSYRFYKHKVLKPFSPKKEKIADSKAPYSKEVEEAVIKELNRIQPDLKISPELYLANDLGLDSLDIAELITFLNLHFHVRDLHPEDMQTVGDVVRAASGGTRKKKSNGPVSNHNWPQEEGRTKPEIKGDTIFESILQTTDRLKNYAAVGDDLIGVISYQKVKINAIALSLEIKKMPGKYIGVMLPASIGADVIILAVQLAGKVPVMMNWTLGSRFLNHMMELTKAKKVISSWRFLERLSGVQFGSLVHKLVLIEDVKNAMPLSSKLKALYLSKRTTPAILKALNLDKIKGDDEAVILFTSGTEANPKGVPLSHKNILSNLRASMQCVNIVSKDIMLGILPPFHSFGFTVAGLLPLMYGIRAAYFPDPTDSHAVAEAMGRWKTTIICSAPSFLKGILSVATGEQVKTMRIFVSGAEKTPEELFAKVKKMGDNKELLEGYGITECSPVIAIAREKEPPKGVGRLIPGVAAITVHPESREVLPVHSEGELCFSGDNIFHGYLGEKKNPFFSHADKKWYCSGDLGYLDQDGYLILSGRLKRFVKVGGEMISLGAIEGELLKHLTKEKVSLGDEPALAILANEEKGERAELFLFTTLSLDKGKLNKALKEAGFSLLVKISHVKKVGEIPLMGTGKIDYRTLQKMIKK